MRRATGSEETSIKTCRESDRFTLTPAPSSDPERPPQIANPASFSPS